LGCGGGVFAQRGHIIKSLLYYCISLLNLHQDGKRISTLIHMHLPDNGNEPYMYNWNQAPDLQ